MRGEAERAIELLLAFLNYIESEVALGSEREAGVEWLDVDYGNVLDRGQR
jgi:hypothetical protein